MEALKTLGAKIKGCALFGTLGLLIGLGLAQSSWVNQPEHFIILLYGLFALLILILWFGIIINLEEKRSSIIVVFLVLMPIGITATGAGSFLLAKQADLLKNYDFSSPQQFSFDLLGFNLCWKRRDPTTSNTTTTPNESDLLKRIDNKLAALTTTTDSKDKNLLTKIDQFLKSSPAQATSNDKLATKDLNSLMNEIRRLNRNVTELSKKVKNHPIVPLKVTLHAQ